MYHVPEDSILVLWNFKFLRVGSYHQLLFLHSIIHFIFLLDLYLSHLVVLMGLFLIHNYAKAWDFLLYFQYAWFYIVWYLSPFKGSK